MDKEKIYLETIECIRIAFSEKDNLKRSKAEEKLKQLCINFLFETLIILIQH